jgi:hypothetical protein
MGIAANRPLGFVVRSDPSPRSLEHVRGRSCGGCSKDSPLANTVVRSPAAPQPLMHVRAQSSRLPPHGQDPNGPRGAFVGGSSVRPACAARGSEHTNPSDDRECLTLGIPELKTHGRISNTRALGGMACESLAATV